MREFEAWDVARAVVEGVFDGNELSVAGIAQVHALGKELANEAIGVLVGAALLRTVRVAEEDVDVEFGAERSRAGALPSPGHRSWFCAGSAGRI